MKYVGIRILGLFVFGAALLSAGSLFLFGSRDMLREKNQYVAYFEQSVNGLNVGAPVKFRGIEIGRVLAIDGVYSSDPIVIRPRITLETYPQTLTNVDIRSGEYSVFYDLVDVGLRASLKSESLLTGQLYVSLDFHDNRPVRSLAMSDDPYPEIPTVDSGFDAFLTTIENLPLEAVLSQLTATMRAVEVFLTSDGLTSSTDALPALLADIDAAVQAIAVFFESDLPLTAAQLRTFLGTSEASLDELEAVLTQFTETMAALEERLDPTDPITVELRNTLREVADAAASLRELADYLETHPEAIVRGRQQ